MKHIGYYIYALHDTYGGAEDRAIEFERKFNEYCIENDVGIRVKRIHSEEELKEIEAIIIYGAHYKNHAIVKYLKDKYKLKVILSSVFVKNGPSILYKILSRINKPKTTQRMTYEILNEADYVFTSTTYEKKLLTNIFNIDNQKISILPNLVDEQYIEQIIDKNNELPIEKEIISDSYICVGRIEPIKNQLIFKGIEERIIFIGNFNNEYKKYCDDFNQMINKQQKLIHINRVDKGTMLNIIMISKGLIMPSFFETTGRVALEAAIMNKPVFTTDLETVKEYLEKYDKAKFFKLNSNNELKTMLSNKKNIKIEVINKKLDFCYAKGISRYVEYFMKILNDK